MRSSLFIASAFLLVFYLSEDIVSQTNPIPNYSFESWGGDGPTGWSSSNSELPGSIIQSSDAQDGGSSVKFIQTQEQKTCGGHWVSKITSAFSINKRFGTFRFFIKAQKNSGTNCFGYEGGVVLYKNGVQIGGTGEEAYLSGYTSWTERAFNINYYSSAIPDSAFVIFVMYDTVMNGSDYMLIDNISLFDSSHLMITRPTSGDKWLAGSIDSIMWEGGDSTDQVFLELSSDDGNSYQLVDFDVPADSGKYVLEVPDTILSTKCRVKIYSMSDSTNKDISDKFKIKGYQLTKLDGNGNYVQYDIFKDRWGFGNYTKDMWPQWWWKRFDYQGIDPFTGLQYSQWQGNFVFVSSFAQEFPNWDAFVRAFSIDACYINKTTGLYSSTALAHWDAKKTLSWGGSCFGIAVANALAFSHRSDFLSKYFYFPSFTDPINVKSDTTSIVIPVISELFSHEFGNPSKIVRQIRRQFWTPNQTLNELKTMLFEDNVKIRTLYIANNNGKGAHEILPFELEQDDVDKQFYYLSVYDNSYPNNTTAFILIDTTGNSNKGSWLTTYGWNNWGGDKYLFLEVESSTFLNPASFPKRSEQYISPFIMSEDTVDIYCNIDANIRINDEQGNLTGYVNGEVYDNIPNSLPYIYVNGSETPPYGYSLLTNNYSVQIDAVESDTLETFFFTGNKTFTYERTGVTNTETDRLFFDGGVSAANPNQDDKTISLVNIINESSQEKLFALRQISLAQDDSVKIENPDDNRLNFISYGSGKTYEVELNFATELGLGRFVNNNINITPNTTHQLVPNWGDFADLGLTIYVDNGNDGTIDDTIIVDNTVDVKDQGYNNIPTEYKLEQNYPNPFNPTTTIRYSIPKAGSVTLKIYNLIGEEIATLVNEEKAAGNYEIEFDATQLPSGVYFYQIKAGDFSQTKKMLLLK